MADITRVFKNMFTTFLFNHFFICNHIDRITTVDSQTSAEPIASSVQVYGIDLSQHDIETLGKNVMMNDNMAVVLMG